MISDNIIFLELQSFFNLRTYAKNIYSIIIVQLLIFFFDEIHRSANHVSVEHSA